MAFIRLYDGKSTIYNNGKSPFLMGKTTIIMGYMMVYPLVICCSLLLKMTINIVSFSMKHGDVP